jgi:hypothetical protein
MTASGGEAFSLSALLRSKSIDTKHIDIIDDNARRPSQELIVQLSLECSFSSIETVDEDENICSKHDDPFMASTTFDLPSRELDVIGHDRGGLKETKKGQSFLKCGPTSTSSLSAVKMVPQVGIRPQRRLSQPERELVASLIDETIELTDCGLNFPRTVASTTKIQSSVSEVFLLDEDNLQNRHARSNMTEAQNVCR